MLPTAVWFVLYTSWNLKQLLSDLGINPVFFTTSSKDFRDEQAVANQRDASGEHSVCII